MLGYYEVQNIAKGQWEFGNKAEIYEVTRDMTNGRMLWQVTENYEIW